MDLSLPKNGLRDILAALKRSSLVGMLGWQDIRQRYRRSYLGPFWLTIGMGVMIGTIGLVFGQIFRSPLFDYLPFLAAGIILWTLILTFLIEGCEAFINAETMIKQLPVPMFVHVLRMAWRNIIIFLHNIIILPLIFLSVGRSFDLNLLIALPGLALLLLNLTWMALFMAIISTRFRDLPQMVNSLLQVFFYVTPIVWMPSMLPDHVGSYLLNFNPVFHLMEIVRAPILGQAPTALNWEVSIIMAVVGWLFVILFHGRFKSRIAYWL